MSHKWMSHRFLNILNDYVTAQNYICHSREIVIVNLLPPINTFPPVLFCYKHLLCRFFSYFFHRLSPDTSSFLKRENIWWAVCSLPSPTKTKHVNCAGPSCCISSNFSSSNVDPNWIASPYRNLNHYQQGEGIASHWSSTNSDDIFNIIHNHNDR